MKTYDRAEYKLKAYKNEQYSLDIFDERLNKSTTEYSEKYEPLYMKAKEEVKKGKICSLWELRYEFIP